MSCSRTAATILICAVPFVPVPAQEGEPSDIAGVPCRDLKAAGDQAKRYFLIGPAKDAKPPEKGFKLLVVLPGGSGEADFNPFVRRIWKNALSEEWITVQLVAPPFKTENVTWPRKESSVPGMKFTAEEHFDAALADVRKIVRIDPRFISVLGWSSGGPPAYSLLLREKSPVTGAIVSMSVFFPEKLPPLAGGKGKAIYLHHSKDDVVCRFALAEKAKEALTKAGAAVELVTYEGGHGWRGDVFGQIRTGVSWLAEQQKSRPSAPKRGP